MNKWEDNDLEKVKITIEIPKNTTAFIVNTLSNNNGVIAMSNTQYDSEDIKKLLKDKEDYQDKVQNNWNELKKGLQSLFEFDEGVVSKDYLECAEDTLEKMQEMEQVK